MAALLVASLPQAMREEMVAYRVRRVHQQLFRLLVCYQPGGSSDRALVLSQLDPKMDQQMWVRLQLRFEGGFVGCSELRTYSCRYQTLQSR